MLQMEDVANSVNCLSPGTLLGEYRLMRVVGEGGFGVVYQARDLSLDRIVAIKEYMPTTLAGRLASNQLQVRPQHRGAFDAGLRSFINEARLLAKFSHPTLVHVYRFFEANGTAYMVMRYYEGMTVKGFLAAHPDAANERWLSAMLVPVLDVLEMLHAADCFHRDISPDNLFLQASGVPVLLDFGAARRIIGDLTQALTMVLKPGFAPIEQYVDDGAMPQGAWTDIYQLAAMLFLAVTGRLPATSVARMVNDPMPNLTPVNCPGYSQRFLQGIHDGLAVRPHDRPQSIAAFREALGLRRSSLSQARSTPAELTLAPDPVAPRAVGAVTVRLDSAAAGLDASDAHATASPAAPTPSPVPVPVQEPVAQPVSPGGQLPALPRRQRMPMAIGVGAILFAMAALWWVLAHRDPPASPAHDAVVSSAPPRPVPSPAPATPAARFAAATPPTRSPAALPGPASVPPAATVPAAATAPAAPTLSPLPAPAPPASRPAIVAALPAPAGSAAPAHAQPAAVETGTVVLRVNPWGQVSVNRVPRGTTPPLRELVLPEGQYLIEISNPVMPALVRMVQVRKGETVVLQHSFE